MSEKFYQISIAQEKGQQVVVLGEFNAKVDT